MPVQWEQYNVSGETTGGEALFQEAMDSLKRNKVGLKGMYIPYSALATYADHTKKVFFTPPSTKAVTTPGTSLCDNNSTSTLPSLSANLCPAWPLDILTSTLLLSVRTLRASTLVLNTSLSPASLSP